MIPTAVDDGAIASRPAAFASCTRAGTRPALCGNPAPRGARLIRLCSPIDGDLAAIEDPMHAWPEADRGKRIPDSQHLERGRSDTTCAAQRAEQDLGNVGVEIGSRLARLRLSRNVTQSMLARDAGIGLFRTLRRVEAGESSSTFDTFLRVASGSGPGRCRPGRDTHGPNPPDRARLQGRHAQHPIRRRATRPRPRADRELATWTWGERPA